MLGDIVKEKEIVVLLHNVRSGHNVGSVFRTADAVQVTHIYLTGYTPSPVDRFGRLVSSIAKTALGAEISIPWSTAKRALPIVTRLKKEGFTIVGLEQDARAVSYRAPVHAKKICLVLGNEVLGMSRQLRCACDLLIEIPMYGEKESLNVSVAAGIALYALREG